MNNILLRLPLFIIAIVLIVILISIIKQDIKAKRFAFLNPTSEEPEKITTTEKTSQKTVKNTTKKSSKKKK